MPLSSGTRLGPHEILGLLGAGGMGEVYRARDTKLNREVAIKVLPPAYASDPERIARFHREAQAIAALSHTSIAGIYDLAQADGAHYLVLELIEGETLAERMRRGPIPIDEALTIAKQILEALEVAHEKGICHRDLKPANVKLTPDGSVKVLDFGLAKFLQTTATAGNLTHSPTISLAGTYPGVIMGTAGYMSPEQAKGFEADQRSDIFSFGCILYELLTGRLAFEGETASEILAGVLKSDVDLNVLPPRLNPRLVEVLRRCLEKNPKKRWHAAADVRVELESVMGRAIVADETRTTPQGRPLWKRAVSAAAFTILGGLIAGYAAWTLTPAPSLPIVRFIIPLPEGQTFTNPGRALVTISPDGSKIVYVANQGLHLRSLDGFDTGVIRGSELGGGVLNPAFSPDGESVVFYSTVDGTLKRLAVTGGAAVTICSITTPFGVRWDEDGIVFGQLSQSAKSFHGIYRVAPSGGTPELIAKLDVDEAATSPQLLPGGRGVLFSVKRRSDSWDKATVVAQPLGGERKVLVEGGSEARYVPTGHIVYAMAGVMLAVPFDIDRLQVTGPAVTMVEGVRRSGGAPGSTGAAHFDYSRTGTLVYLPGPRSSSQDGTDLAIFDRKHQARPLGLPSARYSAPRVSRDGKAVVVETEDDREERIIWVYELDGKSALRRLTFGGKNRAPIWSPDGEWVAFQSDREGDLAIYRQRADGSGTAERLTKPEAGFAHVPQSWSPDGAYMLVTANKDQQSTLGVMSLKDRRITMFDDLQSSGPIEAVFSPDGRWFAYQNRSIAFGSFVEPFPRTGAKYQLPTAGGHPHWSPKGDEIMLNTGPARGALVAVRTAPRFAFGDPIGFDRAARAEPNPATDRRAVDFLPDGDHLIGVLSASNSLSLGATPQIHVVVNWIAELRARVPTR